ncbi:MAG: adenylate/guanylate cyclase domain-containing protein [Ramlibacter sp.]|nr:adenylate/guanylate cyclase domain-containing protein [Ramlibacter sp.]
MNHARSSFGIALMAIAALLAGGLLASRLALVEGLDHAVLDTAFRFNRHFHPKAVPADPVVVGIDEAFLDAIEEPLTLTHFHIARFLDAMVRSHPQAVGLDLALPEKRFQTLVRAGPPGPDFHSVLLAALLRASREIPVVAAKVWDVERGRYRDIHVDYAAGLSINREQGQTHASAIFCSDRDGRIRRYPGRDCQPDGGDSTLAGELSAAAGSGGPWAGLINYQLAAPFTYVPLQQVLALEERGDTVALQRLFQGRVVLLGTVLDDTDLLHLPVPLAAWRPHSTRTPGVLAHAQMLRTMLNHAFIQPAPGWAMLLVTALFSLFWLGRSVVVKAILFSVSAAALLWICSRLLLAGIWLPPAAALLAGLAACTARTALEGWRNYGDKRRLTRTFGGYVSPSVMREIIAGGPAAVGESRKLHVCVMFTDIRGFTTLSEHLPAEAVVALLNRYFARMTQVVHRHEGTVDKFIGDGLMAFFGAPNLLDAPAKNAFAAAQDMLLALDEVNAEFAAEGRPPLAIGVGLHSGEAVIGHIGSAERHSYTAIGDTVNTASRLEGLCKELGYPVLCSQAVADAVGAPAGLVPLGPQALKGRSPMAVFGWRKV